MTTPTLQPQTLLALQYLFQTWKQDNAAQNYALWITSQCVWLCDNNDTTQTIDLTNVITSFLEPDSNNFLNTLEDTEQLEINLPEVNDTEEINPNLELEDIQEEALTVPITNQEEVTPALLPEKLSKIIQDIIQPCGSLTQTSTPPYTGITYQEKLQKILKRIKTRTRNKQDQTKLLEAYYYLGNLIDKCPNDHEDIQSIIEKTQGERRAQDTWKCAKQMKLLFSNRPIENISQTTHITYTMITKLTDAELSQVLSQIRTHGVHALAHIYLSDHIFSEHELFAWRAMMHAVGCNNITPFFKNETKIEFWTYATDSSSDKETLLNLYNMGLLKAPLVDENELADENESTDKRKLWNSFNQALTKNIHGINGMQRILSIIVDEFGPKKLQKKLKVSYNLYYTAKFYVYVNGPGCPAIKKPKITRSRITEVQDTQFLAIFNDKNNNKFEGIYPDGIKRTAFIAQLENGRYVYRKDLSGLCNICNNYGYMIFDELLVLIKANIHEQELQVEKVLPLKDRELVSKYKEKLIYFWAHQALFNKTNKIQIEVQAFDHWSLDTKQDAWFTASSFDSVFETLDPKPNWIKIFSDNGAHYYNSEMMALVTNWYQWYNIEVQDWYFFEPGEAKSLVDSHHATIRYSNKNQQLKARYIRIGYNLDSGKKIQEAIQDLSGTLVANLEPCRDHVAVKTIKQITSFFHWKWPISGELADSIIHKPTTGAIDYTQPKKPWIIPIPAENETNINYSFNQNKFDSKNLYPLAQGWALKSNQKLGQRGAGKRMTSKVRTYLEVYYLAGNINKTDRMSATQMVSALQDMVQEGELEFDEVLAIATVEK
ncbi:hypothetical protein C2G38_2191755 [Gigaspora rosea]|uniref:Uncharacterized protein n=1 Tax=Gigaspora rosea TaxID=44941 RepID=A0A397UZR6_9GLOM|nr:hypothetical protein C2G38_2191755 [Gigaspora rosea]